MDNVRLLLILEVLQKRYGVLFHRQDVFVKVVGVFAQLMGRVEERPAEGERFGSGLHLMHPSFSNS